MNSGDLFNEQKYFPFHPGLDDRCRGFLDFGHSHQGNAFGVGFDARFCRGLCNRFQYHLHFDHEKKIAAGEKPSEKSKQVSLLSRPIA
jgi:hypothetical protein